MNNAVTFRYLLEIQRLEEERKSLRQEKVCSSKQIWPNFLIENWSKTIDDV